jgi:hypothetical protein
MEPDDHVNRSRAAVTCLIVAGLALVLDACNLGTSSTSATSSPPSSAALSLGLVSSSEGYTFESSMTTLPAGSGGTYRFQIIGPDGKPVTQPDFIVSETKLLHFYAIRGDVTDFNHIHPSLAPDGTWSTTTAEPLKLEPGPYRVFAQFEARDAQGLIHNLILSRTLDVPGNYQPTPVPAPSGAAQVDGYTITISPPSGTGAMVAHFTFNGAPVTNLQPYLGSWAHLSAFQEGTLGFGHLHPLEAPQTPSQFGGPDLTFHAHFFQGTFRVYLEFETGGILHTAAFTLIYS